jgi:hypothetical protein
MAFGKASVTFACSRIESFFAIHISKFANAQGGLDNHPEGNRSSGQRRSPCPVCCLHSFRRQHFTAAGNDGNRMLEVR